MNDVIQKIRDEKDAHRAKLQEWLRIPSVSTDSRHNADTRRAAEFILAELQESGFEARLNDTPGHPVVTAEWLGAPDARTLLVYGHYDVQPPDPVALWRHGPFEPVIEGENIVARGATDDKGQALALIRGIGAFLRVRGRLPVNVKFLIEGEEEIGSPNLEPFIRGTRDALAADAVLIADCSQFAPGIPAITVGLKGLVYLEVTVTGPNRDLHSGSFGGAVENPGHALCRLLSSLKDDDGRVTIPGFYDDVIPLTDEERAAFRALPFDEERYRADLGVARLHGEPGFTTLERVWARPTLDVNGLVCGWTGEGAKTVLPARATGKFSMRLVAAQDPAKIQALVTEHLNRLCPPTVSLEVKPLHGAEPVLVPADSPYLKAAARAVARGFGKEPVFMREGGSIPVVATFKKVLGADSILLGLGLNDDNAHSPNEKFSLESFQRGIETVAYLLEEVAAL
ncbi:MAG: dipeptidase [Planctomycetes bacterium]|nr:dipeptidase [Planctomycetota bacterium]